MFCTVYFLHLLVYLLLKTSMWPVIDIQLVQWPSLKFRWMHLVSKNKYFSPNPVVLITTYVALINIHDKVIYI